MAQPELCVIFNPTAGKHRGLRRLEKIRQSWGMNAEFRPTQHSGHAVELAERAAREGFPVVAAAGGDGTAHEVLNGLMRVRNPDVAFTIIPVGSANDYAYSLGLGDAKTPSMRHVDVGSVRTPNGKPVYFGCCLGLGLNGRVTYEARRIRRLQGVLLYGLATVRALMYHYDHPPMTFQIDDEPPWTAPTLLFTALVGKREGGFELAPDAQIDDGWIDYLHAADLTRWKILQFLPRIALFGAPETYPKVRRGRFRRVTLHSETPLIVHTDGEFFGLPKEGVNDLVIEVLSGVLPVRKLLFKTPSLPASRHRG